MALLASRQAESDLVLRLTQVPVVRPAGILGAAENHGNKNHISEDHRAPRS